LILLVLNFTLAYPVYTTPNISLINLSDPYFINQVVNFSIAIEFPSNYQGIIFPLTVDAYHALNLLNSTSCNSFVGSLGVNTTNTTYFTCFDVVIGAQYQQANILLKCKSNSTFNCTLNLGQSIQMNVYYNSTYFNSTKEYNYKQSSVQKISTTGVIAGETYFNGPFLILDNYLRYLAIDNNFWYYSDINTPNNYYKGIESYVPVSNSTENVGILGMLILINNNALLFKRTFMKSYEILLLLISMYSYVSFVFTLIINSIYEYLAKKISFYNAIIKEDFIDKAELKLVKEDKVMESKSLINQFEAKQTYYQEYTIMTSFQDVLQSCACCKRSDKLKRFQSANETLMKEFNIFNIFKKYH